MKWSSSLPQDQTFWYIDTHNITPLRKDIVTDVVVIGGGMAGLSAAQQFVQKGCRVVVLEKNHCGSGASGKSSGFITPDSELSLHDLITMYGLVEAKKLWDLVTSGVTQIKENILNFNLECDYQPQDTLVVASSSRAYKQAIMQEHAARKKLNYASTLYDKQVLPQHLGSNNYYGGVTYGDTFGIQGYHYCLGMKEVLQERGVEFYEESPVIEITQNNVTTPNGSVRAQHIVVCADHAMRYLPSLWDKVYHAQTFLVVSAPLSDNQIRRIFPHKKYMVWDTDLIYQYCRITGDQRLLLGGASLLYTYAPHEIHGSGMMKRKLINYLHSHFKDISVEFEYIWPGLIGISKDLFPIAGHDQQLSSVYYVTACAGLPWAAALGAYSVRRMIDGDTSFDHYFSPYRNFKLGPWTQKLLGTRLTFALNNFLTVSSV